jgi:hypothetical protein
MGLSQIEQIDFSRIDKPQVRKLLADKGLTSLTTLSKLKSLPYDATSSRKFNKHYIEFVIHADRTSVWETYKTISPQQTWNGNMVSFGIMYSRTKNCVTYAGDDYMGLESGQLLFLNLNLFAGFINLAVGHEVVDVDDANTCVTICYLEHGASVGTQKFWLEEVSGNTTKIIHETWYTSGSWLRDNVLYPGFHAKAITEFHTNVKRHVESARI